MARKSKPKSTLQSSRPVLRQGEHIDITASASIIQGEALKVFNLTKAGKISEREGAIRNNELRAASKVIDEELRRER
jgi:hypothetical protein